MGFLPGHPFGVVCVSVFAAMLILSSCLPLLSPSVGSKGPVLAQ